LPVDGRESVKRPAVSIASTTSLRSASWRRGGTGVGCCSSARSWTATSRRAH